MEDQQYRDETAKRRHDPLGVAGHTGLDSQ
jgi:hypothetical protein